MSFGSPEFFLRLKTEFYSDNNWEIHSLLDKEVRRVARFLARQAISDPQLRIDAIEDAVFRIFTYSIHKFLEDPAFETAGERDRINWLYRAVGNAILDSLRRANVRSGVVLRPNWRCGTPSPASPCASATPVWISPTRTASGCSTCCPAPTPIPWSAWPCASRPSTR